MKLTAADRDAKLAMLGEIIKTKRNWKAPELQAFLFILEPLANQSRWTPGQERAARMLANKPAPKPQLLKAAKDPLSIPADEVEAVLKELDKAKVTMHTGRYAKGTSTRAGGAE